MTEKDLWALIKRRELGQEECRWTRIENAVGSGMPDINACIKGYEFWVELKCPKVHKRETTPVFGSSHRLTPVQASFFYKQARAGGSCYLLISNEALTILVDGRHVGLGGLDGLTYEQFKRYGYALYAAKQPLSKCWPAVRASIVAHLQSTREEAEAEEVEEVGDHTREEYVDDRTREEILEDLRDWYELRYNL